MESISQFITRKSIHEKVANYLFNQRHTDGWAKGQWFKRALGFDPNDRRHHKLLEMQILFNPDTAEFIKDTQWGRRFQQYISITGPNGRSIGGIRLIWQRDQESGIIRLLTIMPPRVKSYV